MAPLAAALAPAEQRAVIARVTRRLVAFAFVCYVVAYVDRVNIGFAAAALQRDLHLSDTAYGIGGGLFSSATVSSRSRATSCSSASARGDGSRAS